MFVDRESPDYVCKGRSKEVVTIRREDNLNGQGVRRVDETPVISRAKASIEGRSESTLVSGFA